MIIGKTRTNQPVEDSEGVVKVLQDAIENATTRYVVDEVTALDKDFLPTLNVGDVLDEGGICYVVTYKDETAIYLSNINDERLKVVMYEHNEVWGYDDEVEVPLGGTKLYKHDLQDSTGHKVRLVSISNSALVDASNGRITFDNYITLIATPLNIASSNVIYKFNHLGYPDAYVLQYSSDNGSTWTSITTYREENIQAL